MVFFRGESRGLIEAEFIDNGQHFNLHFSAVKAAASLKHRLNSIIAATVGRFFRGESRGLIEAASRCGSRTISALFFRGESRGLIEASPRTGRA